MKPKIAPIKCLTCLGCNRIENPCFTGTSYCTGYVNCGTPEPEQMGLNDIGIKLNKGG